MIKFDCEFCGHHLKADHDLAGKKVRCKQCRHIVTVPADEYPSQLPRTNELFEAPVLPRRPQITVHVNSNQSSLGITALILGIVAFVFCWIPFLGAFTIPLSGLGILLGGIGVIISIVRKGSGIGFSIGGTAISTLALGIALVPFLFVAAAVETAEVEPLEEPVVEPAAIDVRPRSGTVASILGPTTIQLDNSTILQILGVAIPNTPVHSQTQYHEKYFQPVTTVEQLELHAIEFLNSHLKGERIRLEYEAHRYQDSAYVVREHDRFYVNAEMIKQGYAQVARIGFSHRVEFLDYEKQAKASEVGMWQGPDEKDAVVYMSADNAFHLDGCRQLRSGKTPYPFATAVDTYEACQICFSKMPTNRELLDYALTLESIRERVEGEQ